MSLIQLLLLKEIQKMSRRGTDDDEEKDLKGLSSITKGFARMRKMKGKRLGASEEVWVCRVREIRHRGARG